MCVMATDKCTCKCDWTTFELFLLGLTCKLTLATGTSLIQSIKLHLRIGVEEHLQVHLKPGLDVWGQPSVTAQHVKVTVCMPPDAPCKRTVNRCTQHATSSPECGLTHPGRCWPRMRPQQESRGSNGWTPSCEYLLFLGYEFTCWPQYNTTDNRRPARRIIQTLTSDVRSQTN